MEDNSDPKSGSWIVPQSFMTEIAGDGSDMETETWTLDSENLSQQIIECLKLFGCSDRATLESVTNIDQIEKFLQTNYQTLLQKNTDSAIIAYGVFLEFPNKFKFLPGQRVALRDFLAKLGETEKRPDAGLSTSSSKDPGTSRDVSDTVQALQKTKMASRDSETNTWTLDSENLPEQIMECLKLSGFDNKTALEGMASIVEIEHFLQANAKLLLEGNNSSAAVAYGKYLDCPTQFKFLPDQRGILNNLLLRVFGRGRRRPRMPTKKQEALIASEFLIRAADANMPAEESDQIQDQGESKDTDTDSSEYADFDTDESGSVDFGKTRGPKKKHKPRLPAKKRKLEPTSPGKSRSPAKLDLTDDRTDSLEDLETVRRILRAWIDKRSDRAKHLREYEHYVIQMSERTKVEIVCVICKSTFDVCKANDSYSVFNFTKHIRKQCLQSETFSISPLPTPTKTNRQTQSSSPPKANASLQSPSKSQQPTSVSTTPSQLTTHFELRLLKVDDPDCLEIRRILSLWISRQRDEDLKELREGKHYSLVMISSTRMAIQCLMCKTMCEIAEIDGVYMLSNYFRHVRKSDCKARTIDLTTDATEETETSEITTTLEDLSTRRARGSAAVGGVSPDKRMPVGDKRMKSPSTPTKLNAPSARTRESSSKSIAQTLDEIPNSSTRATISVQLNHLISKQKCHLRNLKEGQHYSLIVRATEAKIRCCACEKMISLPICLGKYVISNYIRHVRQNCKHIVSFMKKPTVRTSAAISPVKRGRRAKDPDDENTEYSDAGDDDNAEISDFTNDGKSSSGTEDDNDNSKDWSHVDKVESIPMIQSVIREKLSTWIAKQTGHLNRLKEKRHYALIVTPTRKEILCLICQKACKVNEFKGCSVLTNYYNHVTKRCAVSNSEMATDLSAAKTSTPEGGQESNAEGVQDTTIHPVTGNHVDKRCSKMVHLVVETAKDYAVITKPWIEAKAQFSLKWVDNILDHTSEADRIVFEDPDPLTGFIMLPDMKWNREQKEELHLVAIVHRKGLHSLRDLEKDHLPLLRNIKDKGLRAIKDKFDVEAHQLRVFLQYHPSHFHLHVHFIHLLAEGAAAGAAVQVERAHMLETVISILEVWPTFYQTARLSVALKEGQPLWEKFQTAGKFDG